MATCFLLVLIRYALDQKQGTQELNGLKRVLVAYLQSQHMQSRSKQYLLRKQQQMGLNLERCTF